MVDCVDKVKKDYPNLSTVELRNMNKALKELTLMADGDIALLNSMRKDFYNKVELLAYDSQVAKVTHALNLKKNLEHVLQPAFRGRSDKGAESLVMFTPFNSKNQTRNASDIAAVYKSKHNNMLDRVLEDNGMSGKLGTPSIQKAIYKDFYDRYWGRHTPNKYGEAVTKTVDGIIKVNKSMVADLRSVGSTIRFNDVHLVSQSWDPSKVLQNKKEFVEDMLQNIDIKSSFGMSETPKRKPRGKSIGVDREFDAYEAYMNTARDRLERIASRMGQMDLEKSGTKYSISNGKRSIIFKDGEGAYDMVSKYGYSDLNKGLKSGINKMSGRHGLTSIFGNNPDEGITALKGYVKDVMTNTQKMEQFDQGVDLLKGTGTSFYNPDSKITKAALVGVQGVKLLTSMRYLGNSAPKVLMDLATTVITDVSRGTSVPLATSRALINSIESVVKGKADRLEVARSVMLHLENHKMALYSDLESGSESLSKVGDYFYKASLMSYVGETMQMGAVKTTMQRFTDIVSKGPKGRLHLGEIRRSGLSGGDMSLLRKILKDSSDKYITPYTVINSKLGTEKSRVEISNKLAVHYLQSTNESITTTDNRIQIWQSRQKPQDDLDRVARSIYFTFMSSMTKETVNLLKAVRAISPEGKVRSKSGIAAIATASVGLALADYVTDSMKKYTNGSWDDKDPTKEEFSKHMIDSGSWGLIVNSIVNAVNGRSPIGTPAPFSIARDISKNIKNEFNIAIGDKDTTRKNKGSSVLDRQLEFLFEMSPLEKLWAMGLLMKAYDSIIEDNGTRSSSRRRNKKGRNTSRRR